MNLIKDQKSFLQSSAFLYIAIILFSISRFVAIFFSFPTISDVGLYNEYYGKIYFGMMPYKDFLVEYPPLSVLLMFFAGKISTQEIYSFYPQDYFYSLALILFIIDNICLVLTIRLAKSYFKFSNNQITYLITLYTVFGLILYRTLYHRLDLIVGVFLLLSLYLFLFEKRGLYLNSIAGFFYKIIPIFNLPIAIIINVCNKISNAKDRVIRISMVSAILLLVLTILIIILEVATNYYFIESISIHRDRVIQCESLYASIILLANLFNENAQIIEFTRTGWDVEVKNNLVLAFSKYFGFMLLFGFYIYFFILSIQKKNKIPREILLEATLIIILLLISFQRVLSPQFFIWLIPIISIWIVKENSKIFLIIFSFLFLSTAIIFPENYFAFVFNQVPAMIILLFIRNITLLILTLYLTIRFLKKYKLCK